MGFWASTCGGGLTKTRSETFEGPSGIVFLCLWIVDLGKQVHWSPKTSYCGRCWRSKFERNSCTTDSGKCHKLVFMHTNRIIMIATIRIVIIIIIIMMIIIMLLILLLLLLLAPKSLHTDFSGELICVM